MCCIARCMPIEGKPQNVKIMLNLNFGPLEVTREGPGQKSMSLQRVVQTILCNSGFTRKHGRTPVSQHQVTLQKWLDWL